MTHHGHGRDLRAAAVQLATQALTSRRRRRLRRRGLRYDDLVRPEYRVGSDAVLERRIYSDPRWTPVEVGQYGS
jgi:hypothetical protein